MARDSAILAAVSEHHSPPTLRLYGWQPPCLSLGRHQSLDAADLRFCQDRGLHVVRRPTGGRAVLHHLELTYAVSAPLGHGLLPRGLQEAYAVVCSALVDACRHLGVPAELTGGEVNLRLPGPRTSVPCFQGPAGGEVVVAGRKLVGSAMRRHGTTILQHGAVLLDWDGALQAGAMGLPDDSDLRTRVTTLAEQLGRPPERSVVETAVADALEAALGIGLTEGGMTPWEHQREAELEKEYAVLPEVG